MTDVRYVTLSLGLAVSHVTVDDDESLRFLLRDLLLNGGVVESSEDGRDALEKVRQQFFNVIVSDISMPAMNGLDFYREAV
jgi:CheY-like chemotaxis protein